MTKPNLMLTLGMCLFMLSSVVFTGCEDHAMDEVENELQPKIENAEGERPTASARYSTGFQGVAKEKLSNGSYGDKIVGLKIVFTKQDGSASYTTYTDSNGAYKITLAAGKYHVVAVHWDYEIYDSAPGYFVVTGTNGYQTGNFFIEKLNYGRQGFTYQRNWDNSIGPKVGNMKLTFTKDDGIYQKIIYSNSSGYYKVSLPKGKYFLKAEKSGYYTYNSTPGKSVVNGSGYSTLNFFLKKKLIISGF